MEKNTIYILLFQNRYESREVRDKEILNQVRLLCQIPEEKPISIFRDSYGKPVLLGVDVEISISHSGNYLAVALSEMKIGVDIEKAVACDFKKIMRYMFTQKEREIAGENLSFFYRMWTKKESYSKFMGKGMRIPFSSFNVHEEKLGVYFTDFNIEGEYIGYVCYEKSNSSVCLQIINLVEKEKNT